VYEEVIATIPQDKSGSRLEVVLIHEPPESPRVELRHLSWGEGIGWYRQHTLKLDAVAIRALGRLLSQVQQRLDHRRTPRHDSTVINNVIPFPGLGQRHSPPPS
jgi:hypothetical protein